MQRASTKNTNVQEVMISATKGEILETFNKLFERAGHLDGSNFCANLAHLSGLFGQLRKYSVRAAGIKPERIKAIHKNKK